jgi:hypothetical protein
MSHLVADLLTPGSPTTGTINIFLDLIIFAVPIPLIMKLQMPKKQRIGLVFVFTIGAV